MIQLQLIEKPKELTDKKVEQFVTTFKKSGSSVYNKPYIKTALIEMSHGKCCYCERLVNKEGYPPIEHFWAKNIYPDDVVTWGNLLLSCTRCNTNKGEFDTRKNPFIHPVYDVPKEHLEFKFFRFYGKSEKGKNTINQLKLGSIYWQEEYYILKENIIERTKDIYKQFQLHQKGNNQNGFELCRNQLIRLLQTCQPTKEFSAITSNFLLNDGSYQLLKSHFQKENIWNDDLEKLESQALKSAL